MTEKTGYKWKASTNQSVSSGIIGVSVDYYFDDEQEFMHSFNGAKAMRDITDSIESVFKMAHYKIAKDIEPKAGKVSI